MSSVNCDTNYDIMGGGLWFAPDIQWLSTSPPLRCFMNGVQSMKTKTLYKYYVLLLSVFTMINGCNDSSYDSQDFEKLAISGSVFASPVASASVTVKDVSGNTVAGPVNTNGDGNYRIEIPIEAVNSALVFESSGGTFADEASGDVDVAAGGMAAYVMANALSAGAQVHMTPGTTVIQRLVSEHGYTYFEAENTFNNALGYIPDYGLAPTSAVNPDVDADETQKLAGLRAAAFSQLALKLGLTSAQQFDLYAALANDLADDSLDGKGAAGAVPIGSTLQVLPEDIHNQFAQALLDFRGGGNDQTGLANNAIGQLPFAKVALTDSYRVEYIPGTMDAMEGKSQFTLSVTDRSTQEAVPGLDITLKPMMYMAMHHHGTPVDSITDNGDGTYTASVYYLMASSMMNGMSMGYWQLTAKIGGMNGEPAVFYPKVMMNMGGDSVQARLKGQDDLIPGMGMGDTVMPENRTYYLFSSGISGSTDDHTFDLFIAAKESMMSYPAIETGLTLNAGDVDYELVVASVTVQVSSDASTWVDATEEGNGHWSAAGISGFTGNVQGTLYVKLSVNGEQKTTDGNAPAGDGSNDYAMFSLTPNAMMSGM